MQFDWDEKKSEKTYRDRGFNFEFAVQIFDGPIFEEADNRRDYGEARINATGIVAGSCLHVTFTDEGNIRRIISARRATKKERHEYFKTCYGGF